MPEPIPEEAVLAAAEAMQEEDDTRTYPSFQTLARIALEAAEPVRAEQVRSETADQITAYEDLLGSIWLYIGWRYVTKQLTTEQKNLFADAVEAHWRRTDAFVGETFASVDRWWSDGEAHA